MAILNYTTKIEPIKTIGEIQIILAKHGAVNISIDFSNQVPVALTFMLNLNGEFLSFRLPSNYDGVYEALRKDPKVPKSFKTQEQARRVAWRITKDWVEAQMAIVEAQLATIVEVFLPYAILPSGQTLYDVVNQGGLKVLGSSINSKSIN